MTGGVPSDRHVELYVRSLHQGGCTARAVDRLVALAETEAVDSYDVVVWGSCAPTSTASARTPMGRYVCDRVTLFQDWARRNDATLEPGLTRERVDSGITGESYEQLCLPTLLVAVYRGDWLRCVAPHETDEGVLTVPAVLDRLDDGVPVEGFAGVERARTPAPTPGPPAGESVRSAVDEPPAPEEQSTDDVDPSTAR